MPEPFGKDRPKDGLSRVFLLACQLGFHFVLLLYAFTLRTVLLYFFFSWMMIITTTTTILFVSARVEGCGAYLRV